MTPAYTKLNKQDVEICRAFRNLIIQGKFEFQGSAIQQGGALFKWFADLDKRIEETLKPAPPPEESKTIEPVVEDKKKAKK
jgi:hypothetical protein